MTAWRKSSYSFSNGNCAEIAAWRASSGSGAVECVEAGQGAAVIGVRDSKDPDGPVLAFSPGAWRRFTAEVRARAAGLPAR